MGTIEVKVLESHFLGERKKNLKGRDSSCSIGAQKVSVNEAIALGLKCVRSQAGQISISDQVSSKRHKSGRLVDTITFNYCSLPGLMHAGVIPMPKDIYKSHRIMKGRKRPPPTKGGPVLPPKRVRVTKIVEMDATVISHTVTCYDLYDLVSDKKQLQYRKKETRSTLVN
jgi:hypothetical protein